MTLPAEDLARQTNHGQEVTQNCNEDEIAVFRAVATLTTSNAYGTSREYDDICDSGIAIAQNPDSEIGPGLMQFLPSMRAALTATIKGEYPPLSEMLIQECGEKNAESFREESCIKKARLLLAALEGRT